MHERPRGLGPHDNLAVPLQPNAADLVVALVCMPGMRAARWGGRSAEKAVGNPDRESSGTTSIARSGPALAISLVSWHPCPTLAACSRRAHQEARSADRAAPARSSSWPTAAGLPRAATSGTRRKRRRWGASRRMPNLELPDTSPRRSRIQHVIVKRWALSAYSSRKVKCESDYEQDPFVSASAAIRFLMFMDSLGNAADGSRVTGRRSEPGCRSLQVAYQAGSVATAAHRSTVQSRWRCPVPPRVHGEPLCQPPVGCGGPLFGQVPAG